MEYLSLFSGIGGFELGINQAYERIRNSSGDARRGEAERKLFAQRENTGTKNSTSGDSTRESDALVSCVGYSEIDKYAIQIYERHFDHKALGDVTEIDAEDLPEFDCLVGGFPCQSFSIAGNRGGFDDTRGTLFFDIARIAQQRQPRLLVLENVKGLLSHDKGRTFRTVIATLDELGYDTQWQVLNSKYHGVPQNRERVFIIGHLRGTARPEVFPLEGTGSKNQTELKELTERQSQGMRLYAQNGVSTTLASDAGGLGAKTGLYSVKDTKIRRLTPLECERLQGFPDRFTAKGVDKNGGTIQISDSQRYKVLGNAVTVNVVNSIFAKLFVD